MWTWGRTGRQSVSGLLFVSCRLALCRRIRPVRHLPPTRLLCIRHCVGARLRFQNVGSSRTDGFSVSGWWPIPGRTFSPQPRGTPGTPTGQGTVPGICPLSAGLRTKTPFTKATEADGLFLNPVVSAGAYVIMVIRQRCRERLFGIFVSVKYLLWFLPLNWTPVLSGWAGCHFQQSPSSGKHGTR